MTNYTPYTAWSVTDGAYVDIASHGGEPSKSFYSVPEEL